MAIDATKVMVGTPDQDVTGAILTAPLGTPLPTTIDDELDNAFTDSGYVSSDGLTLTPDVSTNDINEWGGALVRRILQTFNGTLAFRYIQTDVATLRNTFGDNNVEVTAEANDQHGQQIRVSLGARLPERKRWIFKMKDGNIRIMIVAPDAHPTSWDDITFASTDAVSWPISLSTYPDSTNNSVYLLFDDGKTQGIAVIHPQSVTVDPATATVAVNATVTIKATVKPNNAQDKTVNWSSDNTKIATVNNGVVTGVTAGEAHITATTKDGGKTASSTVTVTAAPQGDAPAAASAGVQYVQSAA